MKLCDVNPFIRFAGNLTYTVTRQLSKTYDCRFMYITGGSVQITLEKGEYTISRGSVFTFQPGTLYKMVPAPFFTAIVIDFDYTQKYYEVSNFYLPRSISEYEKHLEHEHIDFDDCTVFNSPCVFNNMFAVEQNLIDIANEFHLKKLFYKEKSCLLFKIVLLTIAQNTNTTNKKSALMERILDYISLNFNKNITNIDIGKALSYNPNYLNRIMLANTNLTLHQYIMLYRLDHSINLMKTTDKSLSQIAVESGFCSLPHFTKCFRQHTDMPPKDFRKSL